MSYSSTSTGPTLQHSPEHVGAPTTHAQRPQDKRSISTVTESKTLRPAAETTALPSLATLTGPAEPPAGSPTTWRSGGLHNILNPSEPSSSSQQHRSGPGSDARLSQPSLPVTSPRGRKRGESHSPGLESSAPSSARIGRRVLTPRSPGLRAASLGAHRSPSIGSSRGSRQPNHGPEGRHYIAEPGAHHDAAVPPMPSLPVTRGPLPTIQTADHEIRDLRRTSTAVATPLTSTPTQPWSMGGGGSAGGPSSAFAQQRPSSPLYHAHQHHLMAQSVSTSSDGGTAYPTLHGPAIGQGLPRVQSGWKMALDTGQGREVVEVDIDYRQASKMADEKRKRNAGASARFRARRKEKEKESSQMISGLQQELNEMTEERDFYLSERNFYRDLFARSNPAPLPPRPQSPRIRHGLTMNMANIESGANSPYDSREGPEMITQRRRTGEYQPAFSTSPNAPPYSHPYPGPGPAYSQAGPAAPSTFPGEHRSQTHPPPGHHPPPTAAPPLAPSRAQGMDPYNRDVMDRWHPPKP